MLTLHNLDDAIGKGCGNRERTTKTLNKTIQFLDLCGATAGKIVPHRGSRERIETRALGVQPHPVWRGKNPRHRADRRWFGSESDQIGIVTLGSHHRESLLEAKRPHPSAVKVLQFLAKRKVGERADGIVKVDEKFSHLGVANVSRESANKGRRPFTPAHHKGLVKGHLTATLCLFNDGRIACCHLEEDIPGGIVGLLEGISPDHV